MLLNEKNDVWNRDWNDYAWSVYLPGDDGTLANDWGVNLLRDPPLEIMDQIPPAYLQIHQRDILYDEGKMYGQRLQQQKKLAELVEVDTNHAGGLPPFSIGGPGERALEKAAQYIKSFLHEF